MNKLFVSLLVASIPAMVLAQATTPAPASASRTEIKNKAKNLAVALDAAEAALTPGELAIAERVHVGHLPCELGNWVTLAADPKAPGYFDVQLQKLKFRMFPVETSTGAIRLEDHKAGAVWLQLSNKSMLMSQKLGKRLADECMSPVQLAVAEALKLNPAASILEPAPARAAGVTVAR
jgi:hypothetical protein